MVGTRIGMTLYHVDAIPQRKPELSLAASTTHATLNIWHQRLGHVNQRVVKRMAVGEGVRGMSITPGGTTMDECCHGCDVGKMHRLPFGTSVNIPTMVGELIHSDLVGPMQVLSVGGAKYYALFKDGFSRYKVVYFFKLKSETFECFQNYTLKLFTDTRQRVKTLRSDNGGGGVYEHRIYIMVG